MNIRPINVAFQANVDSLEYVLGGHEKINTLITLSKWKLRSATHESIAIMRSLSANIAVLVESREWRVESRVLKTNSCTCKLGHISKCLFISFTPFNKNIKIDLRM